MTVMNLLGNFSRIETNLRHLAAGEWSYAPAGTTQQRKKMRIPLATTQSFSNTFVLWQVDVAFDAATGAEIQVVKVWGIGTRAEIIQSIDRVMVVQRGYSTEDVTRCRQRPWIDKDKNFVPKTFADCQEPPAERRGQELDVRTVDRQVLDMSNRFYTLTEPMIRSVLINDLLAEFPFEFSGDEARSILHVDSSSLILGRSGTGKTTCLAFKLLAKYAAGSTTGEGTPPRQVLLTRSNELAGRLKEYIARLLRTLPGGSSDDGERQEDKPPLPVRKQDHRAEDKLNMPDDSFPLVCTFDYFLDLVEEAIQSMDREGVPRHNKDRHNHAEEEEGLLGRDRFLDLQLQRDAQSVDFYAFKLYYWPKFPPPLVKNLSVELAFAEIMGVIKGSIFTIKTLKPLPRDEYLNLTSRVAPMFTLQSEKSQVYDVFEKYETLKFSRREQDGADRVVKAIAALRQRQNVRALLGAAFDEIYVDEVQDLRCLDIELLLNIINDGRGFHFAGDTAQTISSESHFRFEDVKALFYEHFAKTASLMKRPEIARPQLFLLPKNYRSHQGILGVASLVMEMLWNGFPETVDKLKPEVGQILGPVPVFFLGCSPQMLLASSDSDSDHQPKQNLDFGAEQAIIVRDQNTKARLQSELGERALVLTILQSKGMEFEDVLLFNFFTESPCPSGWRCLDRLQNGCRGKIDTSAGMCSELKHLYVSVTRARIRLSVIETEEDLAARVAEVLKQDLLHPLVEVTTSSDPKFQMDLLSLRSITHDPKRWSERGQELMQRKLYEDAAICFRRAKDAPGETFAMAHIIEENAWRLALFNETEEARSCFRSAADKFIELKVVPAAARNLESAEEFKQAAEVWIRDGNLGEAASSLARGKLFRDSAELWVREGNPSRAAAMFARVEMYKEAAELWDCHHNPWEAASFFEKGGMLRKAAELWMRYNNPTEAALFFVKGGMFEETAKMWAQREDSGKAAPMFMRARMFKEACRHYRQTSAHNNAAEALQQGSHTDELVAYLAEHRSGISPQTYYSLSRFCVLQLKRQKTGRKLLAPAIKLLRDPAQQERAFLEYDMPDQLANLYAEQGRFQEFFLHFFRRGEIRRAVDALGKFDSTETAVIQRIAERVKNFYFADRIMRQSSEEKAGPATLQGTQPDWNEAESLMIGASSSTVVFDRLESLANGPAKRFSQMALLLGCGWLDAVATVDHIPFNAIEEATRIAEIVSSQLENTDKSIVLLLAGVVETDQSRKPFIILPWSPLLSYGSPPSVQPKEYARVAYNWFLTDLSTMMLKLHEKSKQLWSLQWPERCATFLTRGRCRAHIDMRCRYLHKKVDESDCRKKLIMLLKINAAFCGLTTMHGKKLMTGEFQEKFTGVRRFWLEKLIRELTFVSSIEQSSKVIMEIYTYILRGRENPRHDKRVSVVARAMEDLLFHRLGRDWHQKNDLSSLLEQIQLSLFFGK